MTGAGGAAPVRVVGRYALYEAIASGGMATVYLGRLLGPVGFARTVAVKRLHPRFAADEKFVAMFLDEARMAARIRHPHVVQTVDVVATEGELFLVMDYVHGESLSRLLRLVRERGLQIPVPIVVAILSGVLQGLEAAHEAKSERGLPLKIVHRDVSPQNVLVGVDGQARLLDFGVARAVGRIHTTVAGEIKGKVAYMPPEQLRGSDVGPETDVYAATVVLWEALVGRRLFVGETTGELARKVLDGNVTPPSVALVEAGDERRAREVMPLDGIVMRGLSHAQDRRWQTARQLSRALEGEVHPATTGQVSDWIRIAATDALQERATVIERIESESTIDPTARDIGRAIADGAPDTQRERTRSTNVATISLVAVAAPAAAPAPVTSTMPFPLQETARVSRTLPLRVPEWPAPTVSATPTTDAALVASSAWTPELPMRRMPRSWLRVAGVIAVAAGGMALVLSARSGDGPRASGPPLASVTATPAPASAPPPEPPATAPSPAPPAGAAPAAPRAAQPDIAPHAAASLKAPAISDRSPPAHPSARPTDRQRVNDCDPPFVYDANGMKRYKPECF